MSVLGGFVLTWVVNRSGRLETAAHPGASGRSQLTGFSRIQYRRNLHAESGFTKILRMVLNMQKSLSDIRDEKDLPRAWTESDAAYVRVVEDLIELLVDKRIIKFTDLPPMVQQKTKDRQKARRTMAKLRNG